MPASQTNQSYDRYLPQQTRCQDVFEGSDAVKAKRAEYVPLLSGHQSVSDPDYRDYLSRGLFFGGYARTVWGLIGSLFRRPWTIEGAEGEAWEAFLADATLTGMTLDQLQVANAVRALVPSRYGMLTGWSEQAQQPYINVYGHAQIRDWHHDIVDGARRLRWVLLSEVVTVHQPTDDDPFAKEDVTRYWVPRLDENDLYEIQLWEERTNDQGKAELAQVQELNEDGTTKYPARPAIGGQRLDYVPFVFCNPYDDEPEIKEPVLLALADTVLDHLRLDCDLKNALHVLGVPTPYAFGLNLSGPYDDTEQTDQDGNLIRRRDDDEAFVPMGTSSMLTSDNADAQVGFLQLEDSLESLFREKQADERRMAVLGGRLLEEQSSQAEAARTVELRQSGEQSALAAIGLNIAACLTTAVGYAAEFLRAEKPTITANDDFFGQTLESQEITALVDAHQRGAISTETLGWNLQRGEILRPGQSVEEYAQEVAAEQERLAAEAAAQQQQVNGAGVE